MENEELNSVSTNESQSLMEKLLEQGFPIKTLRRGEIIDGSIIESSEKGLLLDVGQKSEGVVLSREMKTLDPKSLSIGSELIVYVMNPETSEGTILLSVDRAKGEQGWRVLERAMEDDRNMDGDVIAINKGGAVVESEGIQGFIPLSQLVGESRDLYMSDNEETKQSLVGMKLEFKITELNRRRNRAIFSERAALEAMKLKLKAKKINELTVGEIVEGKVLGTSSFGVFVDIDGADGLVHISELSWDTVVDPENFVSVGELIKVKVINIEKETLRIALSKKRLEPEPWETLGQTIALGDIHKGRITKITNFGAFARIEGGLEGLVHISEISESEIEDPGQVLSEGEELDLKIIRIDHEKRRLALSVLLDKDHFSKADDVVKKVDSSEKVDDVVEEVDSSEKADDDAEAEANDSKETK
ncbi:MAG: S1 RNA-binding domain-containing protein [Chloroflexota bacterium]